MPKVEVYHTVNTARGTMSLERCIALTDDAQSALENARNILYHMIKSKHDMHNQPGGSYIKKADGKIDKHVELVDTDSPAAAADIWQELFGEWAFNGELKGIHRGEDFNWGMHAPAKRGAKWTRRAGKGMNR